MPPGPSLEANPVMVVLNRLACGWPKARLAKEAGVSASHVSRVEAGILPLSGKALFDYAAAMHCLPEALCVPFTRSPAQGVHLRANANAAEWKRDRLVARANVIAMSVGRIAARADIDPALPLPNLNPADYATELGEITAAQVLRRLWRLAGPIRSMAELLEAAGVFVIMEDFRDGGAEAVTLRANEHHPHLVYVNASLPPDRMRMALAHELGHLVMDATTLASPAETERRAVNFAAEFLAPIDDIGFDLDRVSVRTVPMLDDLRAVWGVSISSLVDRARDRGALSDYRHRSLLRLLNDAGRIDGHQPGVPAERRGLGFAVLEQIAAAGYSDQELDEISLLTNVQRAALFAKPPTVAARGAADARPLPEREIVSAL